MTIKKDEILCDRRVAEKNLQDGLMQGAEYEKFLQSMPDSEKKSQWVAIEDLAPRSYLRTLGMEKRSRDEAGPGAGKKKGSL